METPYDWGTKVFSTGPGHMTKMAATPMYGKNTLNLLLWNKKVGDIVTWHVALGMWAYPSLFY